MRRICLVGLLVAVAFAVLAENAWARGRMYHPRLARFMQRDPVGTALEPPMARNVSSPQFTRQNPTEQYGDGMNLYQFVRSNPQRYVDPFGLMAFVLIYDSDDPMFESWANVVKARIQANGMTYYGMYETKGMNYEPDRDTIHMIPIKGPETFKKLKDIKEIRYLASFGHGGKGKIWWGYDKGDKTRYVATGIPGYRLAEPDITDKIDFSLLADLDYLENPRIEFYHCYTAHWFGVDKKGVLEFSDAETTVPNEPAKSPDKNSVISYFKHLLRQYKKGEKAVVWGAEGISNGWFLNRGFPRISGESKGERRDKDMVGPTK